MHDGWGCPGAAGGTESPDASNAVIPRRASGRPRDPGALEDGNMRGDALPPFGGSWRCLHLLVALNLAVLIALLWAFTRALR